METIKELSQDQLSSTKFKKEFSDCIILTKDNKLIMQYRTPQFNNQPDSINLFGGHIEKNESPENAVIREINEELGGVINKGDITYITSITEDITDHQYPIHIFFWHDKEGTITGCYEGEKIEFSTSDDIIKNPKTMEYSIYAIKKCISLKLINI